MKSILSVSPLILTEEIKREMRREFPDVKIAEDEINSIDK